MKINLKPLWVTIPLWMLFAMIGASLSESATYYVDPAGSDANTFIQAQSQSTPWATVGKISSFAYNLCPYSEQFDHATNWRQYPTKHVTADVAVAPDGTTTADLFVADPASYGAILKYPLHTFTAEAYTWSMYVKKSNHRYVAITAKNIGASGNLATFFDLDTQTWGNTSYVSSYSATDVGSGWWRLSVSGTIAVAGLNEANVILTTSTGNLATLGSATAELYVWGAQLTRNSESVPYVKTVATSATFLPGDSVLFSRGSVFTETLTIAAQSIGSPGSPVTFGSYGTGDKPKLTSIYGNGLGNYVTITGLETTGGTNGIEILGFHNLSISDVVTKNSSGSGIKIDQNTVSTARNPENVVVDGWEASGNANRGLWMNPAGTSYVKNGWSHHNTANGISATPYGAAILNISDVVTEYNGNYGYATAAGVAGSTTNIYRLRSRYNTDGGIWLTQLLLRQQIFTIQFSTTIRREWPLV